MQIRYNLSHLEQWCRDNRLNVRLGGRGGGAGVRLLEGRGILRCAVIVEAVCNRFLLLLELHWYMFDSYHIYVLPYTHILYILL